MQSYLPFPDALPPSTLECPVHYVLQTLLVGSGPALVLYEYWHDTADIVYPTTPYGHILLVTHVPPLPPSCYSGCLDLEERKFKGYAEGLLPTPKRSLRRFAP